MVYTVRGQQVMLDFDLAEIYGYTTKAFNQQVSRNREKFEGDDFMFRLSNGRWETMRSQIVAASHRNDRYAPHAFTEQQQAIERSYAMTNTTNMKHAWGKALAALAVLALCAACAAALAPAAAHASTGSSVSQMHRLYNPNSGEHFYTANDSEKANLAGLGWRYEGVGWYAPLSGADVYRLYNPNAGDHHYTTSAAERDNLARVGWNYEGVGWKSGGGVALFRQYNPNAWSGAHNYTTSADENAQLCSIGWRGEGVGWYGTAHSHTSEAVTQQVQKTVMVGKYRVRPQWSSPKSIQLFEQDYADRIQGYEEIENVRVPYIDFYDANEAGALQDEFAHNHVAEHPTTSESSSMVPKSVTETVTVGYRCSGCGCSL